MNQEKIGKLIAELRKEKNLTQEELGRKLGVTKNAVSKWERGLSLMDMSLLKPLSVVLDISIVELLNGEKISKEKLNEKTEEVVENTIDYSRKEIKKNKYINIALTTLIIIIVLTLSFFTYKLILLERYTFKEPENVKEVVEGLKIKNELKIYKRTIPENEYLQIDDIKLRNDFKDYEKEEQPNLNVVNYTLKENDKTKSHFSFSKSSQNIDLFVSNDINFYIPKDYNVICPESSFTYADRKYFLLKNDINDDVDYINYVRENYFIKNNILMDRRTLMENFAFNLFTATIIPNVESITLITGDYRGYIYNIKGVREVHIIRNDQSYMFLFYGENLTTDDYITDLLSTLEIK